MSSKITEARKAKICKLHNAGKTAEYITSRVADVSLKQVTEVLQEAGLVPPPPTAVAPKDEEALLCFLLQISQTQTSGKPNVDVLRQQLRDCAKASGLPVATQGRHWFFSFMTRHMDQLPTPWITAMKVKIIAKHNKKRRLAHPKNAFDAKVEKLKQRQATIKSFVDSLSRAGKSTTAIRECITALRLPCPSLENLTASTSSMESPAEREKKVDISVVVRDIVLQQRAQPVWRPRNMPRSDFEEIHSSNELDQNEGDNMEPTELVVKTEADHGEGDESLSELPCALPVNDSLLNEALDESLLSGLNASLLDAEMGSLSQAMCASFSD